MIAAILRAQWLSMRSFRLDSRRRGAIFSIITALVWYGFWTFLAFLAEEFTSSVEAASMIRKTLPAGFMFIFLYWQLAPIVSASLGASLDLKKLLVYPVPHQKLFVIEVLLRLTNGAEMLLVLAGTMVGLACNPAFAGIRATPRLLASGLLFVVFNLLLAAGLRNLLERLLTNRRLREIVLPIVAIAAVIPQLLLANRASMAPWRRLLAHASSAFLPWSAVAHLSLGDALIVPLLTLISWTAVAYVFGRWQFERSLHYDAQSTAGFGSANERTRSRVEFFYRLPVLLLRDPLAAVVEKELRALSRTPRFRMVFFMGFSFGLLVWLPIVAGRGHGGSIVADHFLTIVSIYALALLGQVSYLNAFGFDRSAAQVYFSTPVSIAKALVGKNLAIAIFIAIEMLAVTAASLVLRIQMPSGSVSEAFLVTPIVGLYLLAIGNLSSVQFPRAMNPERVSQGGAASRMQALIFVFYPAAILPVFLAFWARYVFSSDLIFYVILAFAALLGGVVYWIAMESAVAAAVERREKILMELSRSEGPVATE